MTVLSDAQLSASSSSKTVPRPLMSSDHALASKGIKANRDNVFQITITGQEAYELLQTLEQAAVDAPSYLQLRPFAIAAEVIREQLRSQGF